MRVWVEHRLLEWVCSPVFSPKLDSIFGVNDKEFSVGLLGDRRRNVRKSTITVGDRILMKNRRTDPLSPIPGTVVKICGNAVTARFENGKVFIRDKSHFKIVRERLHSKGLESDGEEMKAMEKK